MKRLLHIVLRLALVIIPVLLTLPQARAQADTVCAGETSTWVVEEFPGVTYTWELYNDVTGINFATDPGNCPPAEAYFAGGINTGDSVDVMCLVPGTYFIKVTATDSCSMNLKVGKIVVIGCYSYAEFQDPPPVCEGDTALMTISITGGIGPWDVTFTDGTNTWNINGITASPYTFPLIPTPTVPGAYPYWITSVTNGYGMTNDDPGTPVMLIIKPKPVTSPIYRY
jgi:hypothetical protein